VAGIGTLGGMDIADGEASAYGLADTNQAGGKRRRWPEALKREVVAALSEPGASVSIVARRYDVNAKVPVRQAAGARPLHLAITR
jgi:hypothetical protein